MKILIGNPRSLGLRRPQMEEIVRTRDISDSHPRHGTQTQRIRRIGELSVHSRTSDGKRKGRRRQPHSCHCFKEIMRSALGGPRKTERAQNGQGNAVGASAKTIAIEQPAVFGQVGKQLAADSDDVDPCEIRRQVFQDRLSVRERARSPPGRQRPCDLPA